MIKIPTTVPENTCILFSINNIISTQENVQNKIYYLINTGSVFHLEVIRGTDFINFRLAF